MNLGLASRDSRGYYRWRYLSYGQQLITHRIVVARTWTTRCRQALLLQGQNHIFGQNPFFCFNCRTLIPSDESEKCNLIFIIFYFLDHFDEY